MRKVAAQSVMKNSEKYQKRKKDLFEDKLRKVDQSKGEINHVVSFTQIRKNKRKEPNKIQITYS